MDNIFSGFSIVDIVCREIGPDEFCWESEGQLASRHPSSDVMVYSQGPPICTLVQSVTSDLLNVQLYTCTESENSP